jgi:hypothetical protein
MTIHHVQPPAIPNDLGFEAYARPVQAVQPQAQFYGQQGPQLGAYVRFKPFFPPRMHVYLSLPQSVALPDTS